MEIEILNFIQEHMRCRVADIAFLFLTTLGNSGTIWVIAAAVMLIFKKTRIYGLLVLISLVITYVSGELIIKNIVCRIRPCNEYKELAKNMLFAAPRSYSFPSGHTASSFTAAFVINRCDKRYGAAALVLASLIAFSRMYLFVHYPTDILGGIILGCLCAFLVCRVYKMIAQANQKNAI